MDHLNISFLGDCGFSFFDPFLKYCTYINYTMTVLIELGMSKIGNMRRSRVEINFVRLLSRCESMAAENENGWRLEKVRNCVSKTVF